MIFKKFVLKNMLTNTNVCSIILNINKKRKPSALLKIVGAIFALDLL